MVTRVPTIPKVLIWGREKCGLTLEQASERLGRKTAFLEKIESGETFPSVSLFRDMARLYFLPEATLLAEEPPQIPDLPPDHRTFEGVAPSPRYKTIIAIRKVQVRQFALAELAELDESLGAPSLPQYQLADDPEKAGGEERNRIGFSIEQQLKLSTSRALMMWRVALETSGISVFVEELPDARGVSLYDTQFPAIILDQNEKHPAARLFTLMHEYAHLLLRQWGISDQNPREPLERFCNQFAAAFLMPDQALRAVFALRQGELIEPTISELENAGDDLCVSISALALRLQEKGYAPTGYYNRIVKTLTPPTPRRQRRGEGGPPRKYIILAELGHHFTDSVLRTLEHGHISRFDASRLLNASPGYFEDLRETIDKRRTDLVNVS